MPIRPQHFAPIIALTSFLVGCQPATETAETDPSPTSEATDAGQDRIDVHSYARPDEVAVKHLELDLAVNFEAKQFEGHATLQLERHDPEAPLRLDIRDLDIHGVTLDDGSETTYEIGEAREYLGQELRIDLKPETTSVTVAYNSRPEAAALLWLEPSQTAGGKQPFVFSQGQAILTRTWIPCQDTPAVRITYDATIRTSPDAMAIMSAENSTEKSADGVYTFTMPQRIPPYLLAIAVGDLAFKPMSDRTGVFAEPSIVDKAAWEFAETEDMMVAVEELYGPYLWGRYDILVLPPSFPFGGMENPRLTFVTPTILAGDRSLVALIAHELAHSWSGNLVTNATWNDFWLNEGFTVYLERRIMEAISGQDRADMLARLGRQDLEGQADELLAENPADTHLFLDLAGRDPDEGMTDIAYEKGYFFLRGLEERIGRETWDGFLRDYFNRNAFQSLTTADFVEQLKAAFPDRDDLGIDAWIYGQGIPADASQIASAAFDRVDEQIAAWTSGSGATDLQTEGWTTTEWLHFLRGLPEEIALDRMGDLDQAFGFTNSGNSEILNVWFQHAIDNGYSKANPQIEAFLIGMGRRKFLRPIYTHIVDSGQLEWAREIYTKARPGYHTVSTATIDAIVDWEGK